MRAWCDCSNNLVLQARRRANRSGRLGHLLPIRAHMQTCRVASNALCVPLTHSLTRSHEPKPKPTHFTLSTAVDRLSDNIAAVTQTTESNIVGRLADRNLQLFCLAYASSNSAAFPLITLQVVCAMTYALYFWTGWADHLDRRDARVCVGRRYRRRVYFRVDRWTSAWQNASHRIEPHCLAQLVQPTLPRRQPKRIACACTRICTHMPFYPTAEKSASLAIALGRVPARC